ncbi:MAG: GTP-binding protein, partial [Candidatus Aminicenantes bacterium]|nr:GTP-binding protein [Candidatus Aminicenantes bacterium]
MQNIKLHEATKQFNITNKLAMFFLEKHNVPVKSHSSAISMEQLELLRSFSQDPQKIKDTTKEFEKFLKEKKKKPVKEADTVKTEEKPEKDQEKIEVEEKEETPPVVIEKVVEVKKEPEPAKVVEPEPVKVVKPEPVKVVEPVPEKPVKKIEEKIVEPVKKVIPQGKPAPTTIRPGKKLPERRTTIADVRKRRNSRHGRRDHRGRGEKRVPEVSTVPKKEADLSSVPEMIQTSDFITLKELGEKLNIKLKFIEDKMRELGVEFHLNQFLNEEEIRSICSEFNVDVNIVGYEEEVFSGLLNSKNPENTPRPPVVTVMGHVDHGKTTLLDTLRKTRVVEREAGGITQKIGAYKLKTVKGDIVFIDTPGHEAFTNLRARGAKVTDIVVLVVAANDGVKPQTIEAINHARAAEVPLIVAINKIDLDGADPNKVKQELTTHNVVVEDWGGDVVSVDISAKNNTNLDSFLEMVSLVADMLELKSYKDVPGWGTVIE